MTQHDAQQLPLFPQVRLPDAPRPAPSPPRTTSTPKPPAAKPKSVNRHERRTITLEHGQVDYVLRTSERARRVRLVIQPGGALEVVAPRKASQTRIDSALREHEEWIVRTRKRLGRVAPITPPAPLVNGSSLALAGRTLQLRIETGAPEGRFRMRLSGETLTLTLPSADEQYLRAALEAFYRRQARDIFAERLAHWNLHYGYTWTRVAIKEQKTRWGSCSRAGALNFNWRLLLAPLPALDYVVIHELCHLKEPNHGSGFWALVAKTCPNYREWRGWLRQHGHELQF